MKRNRCGRFTPAKSCGKSFWCRWECLLTALSLAIHVLATRVNDIVNGKGGVTADTALRLARYFGNSPGFWLNLQAAHDLRAAGGAAAARIQGEISPRQTA